MPGPAGLERKCELSAMEYPAITSRDMNPAPTSAAAVSTASKPGPWWRLLTGYHWFVLLVASAAWFFDCLDQRLFSLARGPALAELMKTAGHSGDGHAF